MNDTIEMLLKQINNLQKKVEKYYDILYIENELDFIMKGTYIFKKEIDNILAGNY